MIEELEKFLEKAFSARTDVAEVELFGDKYVLSWSDGGAVITFTNGDKYIITIREFVRIRRSHD